MKVLRHKPSIHMGFMFIGRLYLEAHSAYHDILVLGSTPIKQGFLDFVDITHVPMTKAQRICKNALLFFKMIHSFGKIGLYQAWAALVSKVVHCHSH